MTDRPKMHEPADDTLLIRRLLELPRDATPEQDLWPGIEQRIQRRQWRLLSYATAAGLLVISVIAISVLELRPAVEQLATGTLATESVVWAQQAEKLQQLRAELQPTLEQQLAQLDRQTRNIVVENLTVIEQAQHNISDALKIRPQSVALSSQYRQLWLQEMAIYHQVSKHSYKM